MQHRIWLKLSKNPIERRAITDVCALEGVARIISDSRERFWIGSIGQLVGINDRDPLRDQPPAHRRSDESRPSRDQPAHLCSPLNRNTPEDYKTAVGPGLFPKLPPPLPRPAIRWPALDQPSERRGRARRNRGCRPCIVPCCQAPECNNHERTLPAPAADPLPPRSIQQ